MGCGEQRRGRCRGSQDALAPGPAPQAPRRGKAAAGAGRRPPPQQLAAARGAAGAERRGRREGPAGGRAEPRVLPPGCCRRGGGGGGWPRKGGAPGRAAGGPRGAPRTKGDGDGSSVVKTTCAGGGPRPGRGLGALHLNPFAAAASFLRLVGGRERPVLPQGAGEVRAPGRGRALAGRDPGAARGPPPSPPRHLAPPPCPAPFPTWIPGRLANSLLREAGGVRGTRTI